MQPLSVWSEIIFTAILETAVKIFNNNNKYERRGKKKMLKNKEIMGWVDCVCYEKKKKNYFLKHQTKQKNYKKKNIYLERGGL